MDHIGPLSQTKKNYKHVLVMVDAFTKYVWIFPSKTPGAKETLKKMAIFEQHFGSPHRIITDRGSAFTSEMFKQHCEANGVQNVRITTGKPNANGQVERINAIVETIFTKLAIEEPQKWYKYAGRVQRAINSTWQRSIKTTPYELLFGIKMSMPNDAQLLEKIEEAFRLEFQQERDELRESAIEEINKIQQENKKSYDKKRKAATVYKEGDIVAILRTQQGPGLKLRINFLGPYKVTKVKLNDRYDVEKIGDVDGPERTSTSADHMKPWRGFREDLEEDDIIEDYDTASEVEEDDEVSQNSAD